VKPRATVEVLLLLAVYFMALAGMDRETERTMNFEKCWDAAKQ
jgi:hypothetical protein